MNSEFILMKKLILFLVPLISLSLFSCEDNDPKNARIEVWLTDEPGDYQEVNVDVQGVEVHSNETDDDQGWQSIEITPKVYNLLDLANGNETFLGDLELPAGRLSQIRLILGDDNTVKVDDQTHPLTTPSAQQSGLKIQMHQTLAEGVTYKITLDFEAGKSVVETGSGAYILKPVIRAMTEAQDGVIKGSVEPAGVVAISLLDADGATVTTTSSDEEGNFLIGGLEAGTYKLVFDTPGDDPLVEKADVTVVLGEVTEVGVVDVAP